MIYTLKIIFSIFEFAARMIDSHYYWGTGSYKRGECFILYMHSLYEIWVIHVLGVLILHARCILITCVYESSTASNYIEQCALVIFFVGCLACTCTYSRGCVGFLKSNWKGFGMYVCMNTCMYVNV